MRTLRIDAVVVLVVLHKTHLVREGLLTEPALVRLLIAMQQHVRVQITLLVEAHLTSTTTI